MAWMLLGAIIALLAAFLVGVLALYRHALAAAGNDEAVDWRVVFRVFYDAVDRAEKVDTNAGDSAVSVALWTWAQARSEADA